MKKLNPLIVLLTAIFIFPALVLADAQYREVNTSQGKVIVGLDREKAYQSFGAPASKGDDLWHYTNPTEFFVSFSENPSILLFPVFCEGIVGIPLEFKAFLRLPDLEIRDITKEVQLVFDQPECARLLRPGVIIPKKAGKYSALTTYQEILSNPLNLEIKESGDSDQKAKEILLSIDILPYRPTIPPEAIVDFLALGTFFDYDLNRYSVRDISQEASWQIRMRPNLTWNPEESNRLYFLGKGQAEVLSKYQETESFIQRVEVKDQPSLEAGRLKHLLVLPEVMVVLVNNNTNIRVFGTYYDNSVKELTQDVRWRIANPDILESNKNGYFFTRSEGVTEVVAIKDGVESLPVKVVVVNKSGHFIGGGSVLDSGQDSIPDYNMLDEEIEDNIDKLKKDFSVKKKELKNIMITPKLLEIGLGEEGKLSATGIYEDGSSSDLTILGEWGILNKGIATVAGGNVACIAVGETNAYVEFKGVRSEYARVVVGGPRLLST